MTYLNPLEGLTLQSIRTLYITHDWPLLEEISNYGNEYELQTTFRHSWHTLPEVTPRLYVYALTLLRAYDRVRQWARPTPKRVLRYHKRYWHECFCLVFTEGVLYRRPGYRGLSLNIDEMLASLSDAELSKVGRFAARASLPFLAGGRPLQSLRHTCLDRTALYHWMRQEYDEALAVAALMRHPPLAMVADAGRALGPRWQCPDFHEYGLDPYDLRRQDDPLPALIAIANRHYPAGTCDPALVALFADQIASQLLGAQAPERPPGITDTVWQSAIESGVRRALHARAVTVPGALDLSTRCWQLVVHRSLQGLEKSTYTQNDDNTAAYIANVEIGMQKIGQPRDSAVCQILRRVRPSSWMALQELRESFHVLNPRFRAIRAIVGLLEDERYDDFAIHIAATLFRLPPS